MPVMISAELAAKQTALDRHIGSLGRLLIAYSGGVDSAYLAWAAWRAIGSEMLAVIADSPSLARAHLADAIAFAREQVIPLEILSTHELEHSDYSRNDERRCYFCKDELFTVMEAFRKERGFDAIAYGLNADDQGDFRPGQVAAREHKIAAPLMEAGLGKHEIRELARVAGLRVWDKPASACLSSRIEYGQPVTEATLRMIERGEDELRRMGFRQFRVRYHGEMVRIEIDRSEMQRALTVEMADQFSVFFKALGFKFVTLDLGGFRTGSMNAFLSTETLTRKS
jgi:pyridinium-3,5-biscarboxylic acid mononucleotide sulfurtransferase